MLFNLVPAAMFLRDIDWLTVKGGMNLKIGIQGLPNQIHIALHIGTQFSTTHPGFDHRATGFDSFQLVANRAVVRHPFQFLPGC